MTANVSAPSALGALGDPTRRAIFELIAAQPSAVSTVADSMPVSRPAVSQHLRVLKEAGLVTDRRDGARRIYAIDLSGLAELRDYLDRFWGLGLARYKAAAERKEVSPDG